ncbi:MAG: hypothetical protein GXP36_11620 [Actinobacteria bacterium]|nr:hypothetical protein [Actinomycetota bacterium]
MVVLRKQRRWWLLVVMSLAVSACTAISEQADTTAFTVIEPTSSVTSGVPEVSSGEVQCEPMKPFTDNLTSDTIRCVSVLRPDGSYLMVFFPEEEDVTAVVFTPDGVYAVQKPVPRFVDLATVSFAVDEDGNILVTQSGKQIAIVSTSDW